MCAGKPDGDLFLGIDVSTTSVKALLVAATGEVVEAAATDIPLSTPRPLWSEQDPQLWWAGLVASLARLDASRRRLVRGVGLTGQMHGLVLLDQAGRPLRPAILWNDQRTGPQCQAIREKMGGLANLVAETGNDALTGFTAPKILWVREHQPEVYRRIQHILLPKDYVRFRLTGDMATDVADGAGTLLMNVARRRWSDRMLQALDIPTSWLPELHEGPEVTGAIHAEAAAATGLPEGTPVVGGGGDQAAGAVGMGVVQPGIVSVTLGTSGVVFAATSEPAIEPEGRLHAFCHSVPPEEGAGWHLMGVMLSAAGSLRWYRDALAPGGSFEELLAPAAGVEPGCQGLFFLPYLSGERTPHPDPLARAAFVGLTLRHSQAHLTRAVLEGVAFGLKDGLQLMHQAGLPKPEQVRLSGGGAKSPLWRAILASVLEAELATVNTTEGAAYGAALLAGVGGGAWSSVGEACTQAIQLTGRTAPDPQADARYRELYPIYQGLYPALRSTFAHLAEADH